METVHQSLFPPLDAELSQCRRLCAEQQPDHYRYRGQHRTSGQDYPRARPAGHRGRDRDRAAGEFQRRRALQDSQRGHETAGDRARQAQKVGPGGGENEPVTKIIPFPAGRSLILLASGDDMAIIKGLIVQMDQEMSGARSNINLFYLGNADAITLAVTLNEILTGIKTEARTAEKGAAGSPLSAEPVTITADKRPTR